MTTFTLTPSRRNPFSVNITLLKRHKIVEIKQQIWLLCDHYELHPWDSREMQLVKDIFDCIVITCSQVVKENGSNLNYLDMNDFKEAFRIYRMQCVQN